MKPKLLTAQQTKVLKAAVAARRHSYAPYSNFKVGAALECSDGTVFTGCNVENASYSPTCCAERVAIFKAVSEGKNKFKRIAIAGGDEKICPPCGVCRQVIFEFSKDLEVIIANSKGDAEVTNIRELLPKPFSFKK